MISFSVEPNCRDLFKPTVYKYSTGDSAVKIVALHAQDSPMPLKTTLFFKRVARQLVALVT